LNIFWFNVELYLADIHFIWTNWNVRNVQKESVLDIVKCLILFMRIFY